MHLPSLFTKMSMILFSCHRCLFWRGAWLCWIIVKISLSNRSKQRGYKNQSNLNFLQLEPDLILSACELNQPMIYQHKMGNRIIWFIIMLSIACCETAPLRSPAPLHHAQQGNPQSFTCLILPSFCRTNEERQNMLAWHMGFVFTNFYNCNCRITSEKNLKNMIALKIAAKLLIKRNWVQYVASLQYLPEINKETETLLEIHLSWGQLS